MDAKASRLWGKKLPLVLVVASICTGLLAYWDAYEWFYHHSRRHEAYNYDEIVAFMALFLLVGLLWISWCLYQRAVQETGARKRVEARLARLNLELDSRVQERTADLQQQIRARQRIETRLLQQREHLRALSTELAVAQDQERQRIAADLHDNIGQTLALANNYLLVLQSQIRSAKGRQLGNDISALIKDCIGYSRSLVSELNCSLLHSLSFPCALECTARDILESSGIALRMQTDGEVPKLPRKSEIVMFKAAQESLVNVIKHAQATNVQVRLYCDGACVTIEIQDDGIGFDMHALSPAAQIDQPGCGMFMNRERLACLKGSYRVTSHLGAGTRIALSVPLRNKAMETSLCQ